MNTIIGAVDGIEPRLEEFNEEQFYKFIFV